MTVPASWSSLRVERALRLLPDLDSLSPLRAFLISGSRPPPSGEPDRTVGKRYVPPEDLSELVPRAIAQSSAHLETLYHEAVAALDADRRGDSAAAVHALLRAGEAEERSGRASAAWVWYDQARKVGEPLRDRRPEIAALCHLGQLMGTVGRLEEGTRFYQQSLALAEAESDGHGAALACEGLGELALRQARWPGAESWFSRGLQFADDPLLAGQLYRGLGDAARNRRLFDAAADRLRRARELFEQHDATAALVHVLNTWAMLECDRGRPPEAFATWQESLVLLRDIGGSPRLEIAIRLNICRQYLEAGRFLLAEDQIRLAEETAIAHGFSHDLARLYVMLGKIRARQGDESGFVFFEKAVELCRGAEPAPGLEAQAYLEYGLFRRSLGQYEEATSYLDRARELLATLGNGVELEALALLPCE